MSDKNTQKTMSNKEVFDKMAETYMTAIESFISRGFTREEAVKILTAIASTSRDNIIQE